MKIPLNAYEFAGQPPQRTFCTPIPPTLFSHFSASLKQYRHARRRPWNREYCPCERVHAEYCPCCQPKSGLRPLTFLSPIEAPLCPFLWVFYVVRIDDQYEWMLISATPHALDFDQVSHHFLPNPKVLWAPKIAINRFPRWKILRQHPLLPPRFHHIQNPFTRLRRLCMERFP